MTSLAPDGASSFFPFIPLLVDISRGLSHGDERFDLLYPSSIMVLIILFDIPSSCTGSKACLVDRAHTRAASAHLSMNRVVLPNDSRPFYSLPAPSQPLPLV